MCTGFEIALLGLAGAGVGSMAVGQSNAKKANAYAMGLQTQMSAQEFEKRNQLAKEVFGENFDLSKATYDQLASLDDESFQKRTGLSKDAFNQLGEIDKQQVVRDAAASDANLNSIIQARTGRDATRDDARAQYNATLGAANQRQDQFRSEGDQVAANLVGAFSPGAMEGRRADAVSSRDALVASAMTPTGSAVPLLPSADARTRATYARYSDKGRQAAADQSKAYSKVAGYGDALGEGGRNIDNANLRTTFITDASRRAVAPLGAQLGVQSLRYNDAADAATQKAAAADADLAAALGLSSTRASGESRGVTSYTGAMDDAMSRYYQGKGNSISTHSDAIIDANNTKLDGANSVSQNLENAMGGFTQFRMANSGPGVWGTIGALTSAITPALMGQANKNGTGFGFNKPAPPPTILT